MIFLLAPMLAALAAAQDALRAAQAARPAGPVQATVVRQVHVTPPLLTHEPAKE